MQRFHEEEHVNALLQRCVANNADELTKVEAAVTVAKMKWCWPGGQALLLQQLQP
jgi:hypothetical protein